MDLKFAILSAILLLFGDLISAYPSNNEEITNVESSSSMFDKAYNLMKECGHKDFSICLKMRALTYVDKALRKPDDIQIFDGMTLVKSESNNEADRGLNGRALSQDELDASLPKDAEDKSIEVENMLFDRIARFLGSHTLQLKVPDSSISEMKKGIEEARGKKKSAKKILPALIAMIIFKKIALIPWVLGTLALLAFKALLLGKIALVISAIIGLHKLLAHKHHSEHVEVVAHPHHEEHGGHHYAARSFQDAQEMAYSSYVPKKDN